MAKGIDPRLLKNKAFRALADLDEEPMSEASRRASSDLRKRVRRISQFLGKLGSTTLQEPLLSERMLRASEEELDELEKRLLKNMTKPSPTA